MNLDAIEALSAAEAKRHLREILTRVTQPAFGVLPQRELDLMMFQLMRETGVLEPDASLYSLMTSLRISRAKARNLMFEAEIRETEGGGSLDARVRAAISSPRGFVRDGSYLVLGIENPVVQAHMRERVRALGHITDASFDSTLVRIKPDALAALAEDLMDDDDRSVFREAMIEAGYDKDESLRTALREGLVHLAGLAVGEPAAKIGAGYLEDLADFLAPHARKAKDRVLAIFRGAAEARRAAATPLKPA